MTKDKQGISGVSPGTLVSRVPAPPTDATVKNIVCEYCPVACGYKAYLWPVGTEGGPKADENALGIEYPASVQSGRWPSPTMFNTVTYEGKPHNIIVIPDGDSEVVNIGGTHSVRGGSIAQKLYNPQTPTADRLKLPLLRVRGTLQPISWDAATDIVAEVSRHVIENHGELAWGMKRYSYQFYENVYAVTKLALGAIGSANHAPHHAPADGDDVPGLSDTGIDAFGSAYEDDKEADVLFISGSDPYETKTVRFTTWMVPGGATMIYVDPRRTFSAAFAESRGGLHLQINPGTDTALYGAIARVILDNGWEDTEFIGSYMASSEEVAAEGKWRRARFGLAFDDFKSYITSEPAFALDEAERITGVPAAKITEAAELMTGDDAAERPKLSIRFEKGLYWSHNYENTAAIGNFGLLTGSVGSVGRSTSRLGGHQRGGQSGASYPLDKSPHEFERHKVEMDQDRWVVEGKTRFMWAIGTNWIGASACSQQISDTLRQLVLETDPQVTTAETAVAIEQLKQKVDNGGMVLVHQEIYPNDTTEFADLVLPAAAWGEEDFARNNAERRLRIYEKISDAPGEARPDWKIVAEVAQKMGFEGFDWADSNEIFEEASERSKGGRRDYAALVEKARADGKRGHDLLREFGTQGLQTPLKLEGGELVETPRLHADLKFKTDSGKANFVRADWSAVNTRNEILGPEGDELWITNMRVNHYWNNLSDFTRRPYTFQRYPVNFIEISPQDAESRGIKSGDMVSVHSDRVINQVGQQVTGGFTAVAYVTDVVPPGLASAYFHFPKQPANSIVSADTSLQPLNLRYQFKLGRGKITRIGPTELAERMSFAPRNIV